MAPIANAEEKRRPVALVFQGEPLPRHPSSPSRMHFMSLPAVATLVGGLLSLASEHTVAYAGGCLNASFLRPGDLVVFVGAWNFRLPDAIPSSSNHRHTCPLPNRRSLEAAARRARTVYFTLDPRDCGWTRRIAVHEIWAYARGVAASQAHCRHFTSPQRVRYVPPGFVQWLPRPIELESAPRAISFVGGLDPNYAHRIRSVEMVERALAGNGARMLRFNSAWSIGRWGEALRRASFVLNIEKFEKSHDCSTLRFAPMLSSGAVVISEPCEDVEDVREWSDYVFFEKVEHMAQRFETLWRTRSNLSRIAVEFRKRFAPADILRRAGVDVLLNELAHNHSLWARSMLPSR
ncbi:MAG: hypothetical protein SGPRY_012169 [Prymnesium sp.]